MADYQKPSDAELKQRLSQEELAEEGYGQYLSPLQASAERAAGK